MAHSLLLILLSSLFVVSASAQEIDDVELSIETAISESEAVLGEAEALDEIRKEEEALLEKRKREAKKKQTEAARKEKEAKAEIARLDKAIINAQKQREKREESIREAIKKIEKYNELVKKTQDQHAMEKAKLDAANEAYNLELKRLKEAQEQINRLRAEILQNRKLAAEKRKQYGRVKKHREYKERELASLKSKSTPAQKKSD